MGDHALRVRWLPSTDPSAGARPTLVFLHDSLGCITAWRDFPVQLAGPLGLHALVYDRRGYGGSSPFLPEPREPDYLEREADALAALLDAAGVAPAVLFGHSDGGSIALIAAARHPARVAAIITEGAHVFVEPETLAGIRQARDLLATTDLRERLQRHHGDRTDGVTAAWIDTWLDPRFRGWTIESLLPAIGCPTLVLQGEHDEYGTAAQVAAIAAGVAGPVEAHLIAGAAHTPHREATAETLARAVAFLQRIGA